MKSSFFKFSVRDITEIAVMCALAIVLDRFVKIPIGATGGSFNIAAVPLFVIAFRHGWFKGLIGAGVVFGITTCLLDAYGFQFFVFDYFVAFGSIAIAGLFGPMIFKNFNKKSAIGKVYAALYIILVTAIFCVIRTLSASMDSMIFYGYTFGASVAYNIGYVGPSAGIVAAILILLLPVFKSINQVYPTVFLKDVIDDEDENEEEVEEEKEENE